MAQSNEEKNYIMKMYETQADTILKQEELDKMRQEIVELRQRLGEMQSNDSLVSQEPSNTSETSKLSSIEDQVKDAKTIITEKVVSLKNNVEKLSKRGEENQERMKKKSKQEIMNPNQILVMGGYDGDDFSPDIFLLDYHEKTWKQVSIELPYMVAGHGTVVLDDKLYIIGGFDGEYLNSCHTLYRLNKQMNWEKLADMQEKRAYITNSCFAHNECIWVIGGSYLNTIEKYDPSINRWEMKPAMKRRRYDAAAAVISNKIYICGGSNLDSVEVFDIDSEVWTDFCTMPAPRYSMSIIIDGTNIILIGGYNNGSIENNVWKLNVKDIDKGWINLPPLNGARYNSSAVRLETGCILVFGGRVETNREKHKVSCSVEIFDGQKWETFSPLLEPGRWHTSVVLSPAMTDFFRPFIL